ncbi:MAG: hypothetical protein ABJM38_10390, partial [Nitratireductor sp.]
LGTGRGAFDATLGVMELITGSAVAANGQNQVALDLGAAIPGLARVTAAVAIGEPMQQSGWFALGDHGAVVRTAQTRARIDVQIGGTGILSGVAIKLPLFLEVAYAEGRLKRIACPDGTASSAGHGRDAAGHRRTAYCRDVGGRVCRLRAPAVLPGRRYRLRPADQGARPVQGQYRQRAAERPALQRDRHPQRDGQDGVDTRHHRLTDGIAARRARP